MNSSGVVDDQRSVGGGAGSGRKKSTCEVEKKETLEKNSNKVGNSLNLKLKARIRKWSNPPPAQSMSLPLPHTEFETTEDHCEVAPSSQDSAQSSQSSQDMDEERVLLSDAIAPTITVALDDSAIGVDSRRRREKVGKDSRSHKSSGDLNFVRTLKARGKSPSRSRNEEKKPFPRQTISAQDLVSHLLDPLLIILDCRKRPRSAADPEKPEAVDSLYIRFSIWIGAEHTTVDSLWSFVTERDTMILPLLSYAVEFGCRIVFYDEHGFGAAPEILKVVSSLEVHKGCLSQEQLFLLEGGMRAFAIQYRHKEDYCVPYRSLKTGDQKENPLDKITNHIFLGRRLVKEYGEYELLEKRGITHKLNVSHKQCQEDPAGIQCNWIVMEDQMNADLSEKMVEAAVWISEAVAEKGSVYVHCSWGLSRSPTIVMAYLLLFEGMSLLGAFHLLLRKRSVIGPQANFMLQLTHLERHLHMQRTPDVPFIPTLPLQLFILHEQRVEDFFVNDKFIHRRKKGTAGGRKKKEYWEKLGYSFMRRRFQDK